MTHRARAVGWQFVIGLCFGFLVTPAARAQQAPSGIAGVVKDESGLVLPGVTVEAASPALIEKVRSAVTDGDGRFNIVDLRPGSYVVTFSLEGFNALRRDGITLTAGFTATVNADLKVGALAETITVTGAAPLVDTQNVRQQKVVSAELLETLPTGSKAIQNLVTLTPGMTGTADVGGSSGLYRSNGPRAATFHGKTGVRVLYDGMNILASGGTGSSNGYLPNPQFAEESTVETGGISAESSGAGILINQIPKSGGNTFTSTGTILYTTNGLQSNNLTQALRDRGLQTTNEVLRLYDTNLTVGGPIKRDRLWFFAAARAAGNRNTVAGIFFNATPHTPFYTPDLSRPGYRQEWIRSAGSRFTWQASQKNKFSGIADVQGFYNRGRGEFADPTSATSAYNLAPVGLYQATWNSVQSNKLLFEAGFSYAPNRWPYPSPGDRFMAVNPDDISILENSTGFRYNGKQFYTNQIDQFRYSERASVSYVTGSHAFKGGVQIEQGINNQDQVVHGDVNYIFLNGVPNQVTQWATPYLQRNRAREIALYAQDQWTMNRLTINAGLRLDWFVGRVPAQSLPVAQFTGARDFDAVENVPNWKDVSPRLGASYDLFGNGRTAVKVSMGRYLEQLGAGIASENNPVVRSVLSSNRTWNDSNQNYRPDCDLTNF
ncbi:MAG: carboxypeptidase regulatory-like domain-containing protein, partial [Vicinamibacterales bacterium]